MLHGDWWTQAVQNYAQATPHLSSHLPEVVLQHLTSALSRHDNFILPGTTKYQAKRENSNGTGSCYKTQLIRYVGVTRLNIHAPTHTYQQESKREKSDWQQHDKGI